QAPGSGRQGGFQGPEVTDKDCEPIKTAMAKKPNEVKKLDGLRERMRSGELDRNSMRAEQQKIYAAIGVDATIAGACRMREMRANGGGQFGGGQAGGGQPTAATPAANAPRPSSTADRPTQGAAQPPQLQMGNTE